ncbi:hypothetical protein ECANGB1_1896 [Enterospora canceri]|uniref:Uncharacterized protein n=1 Tax=Enterospora canceri TaxID=1081671 RepID=A0A1Y1S944_9MICR|nr:hypothetical protein ECANGB1_1896 [Enterospora canceri]
MIFSHISVAYGFYLAHHGTQNYVGIVDNKVMLVDRMADSVDVNMMKTEDKSILHSVLSLGQSAIAMGDTNVLVKAGLNASDSKQAAVVVLTHNGTYVVKFADKCLGESTDSIVGIECTRPDVLEFDRVDMKSRPYGNPQTTSYSRTTRTTTSYTTPMSSHTGFTGGSSGMY